MSIIEKIRCVLRYMFGYRSNIYSCLSQLINFLAVVKHEGFRTWLKMNKCSASIVNGKSICIRFKNILYPITLRNGTEDVATVINSIVREEYGQISSSFQPQYMIDAGAYIGDTAAYFLSKYPALKIVALEPQISNYLMAKNNLEQYGARVTIIQKGLWGTDTSLSFCGDNTSGSFLPSPCCHNCTIINCSSIPSIVKEFSFPKVDILKIDIEGAERDIFTSNPEAWLHLVNLLIIEIHGADNLRLLMNILQENSFSMRQFRSVWYCLNKKFI